MTTLSRWWLVLWIGAATSYLLWPALLPAPFHALHKALPIGMLLVWGAVQSGGKLRLWVSLAMLFSMMGDVLLALPFANHFLFGLGAFLLAQLTYVKIFSAFVQSQWRKPKLLATLGYLVYCAALLSWIMPQDSVLRVAVSVYVLVIASMAILSVWSLPTGGLIAIGAALFVASDSMIAINRFVAPFEGADLLIMLSYYLAQLALVTGIIRLYRQSAG